MSQIIPGRLHLSTYAVLVIVSAVLFLAMVPGTREVDIVRKSQVSRHGWPLTFVVREKAYLRPPDAISIWQFNGVTQFHLLPLVADMLTAICILATVAVLTESRARRRPWFKISLMDAFAILTLVAIGCAWFAKYYPEYRQTQALLPLLTAGTRTVKIAEGRFHFFDRITEIDYGQSKSQPKLLLDHPAALHDLNAISFYRDPGFAQCLPVFNSLPGPVQIAVTYIALTAADLEKFKHLPKSSCIIFRATNLTPQMILDFHAARPDISVILTVESFNPAEDPFR